MRLECANEEGDVGESNEGDGLDAAKIAFLAGLAGVELGEERAAALVAQAEPHFGLMRALNEIEARGAEPAAEFRLDTWRRASDV
jgi:Asp-tRNA(Asn)/Glu-tRNA(Gln) amidotransferase C subunit